MSNAGFNAATDIFGMGENWKVKSSDENGSVETAECPNRYNDMTHRDQYGQRIAPSATYELVNDVTTLPDIGSIVTIGDKNVAIQRIRISTGAGKVPTAEVSGVQVEDGAKAKRTYSCGEISLTPRHRAQDILKLLGEATPDTLTEANVTFEATVQASEPKGEIVNHDVFGGRYEAEFTHTCGTAETITAPTASGTKVVSSPVSNSYPENDYIVTTYSVADTLVGTDA